MATACGGTTRMSWISRAWKPPCRGEVAAGGTAAGAPSLLSHQAHRGASSTRNGGGETSGDGGPRCAVRIICWKRELSIYAWRLSPLAPCLKLR